MAQTGQDRRHNSPPAPSQGSALGVETAITLKIPNLDLVHFLIAGVQKCGTLALDAYDPDKLLVSVHIPKTAGTSLAKALET